MIIPPSGITPLDPRFPIALTEAIPIFGALLREWEDQETVIEQAKQAAEQAMRQEERYVAPLPRREPRWIPAAQQTSVDMQLPDDWYGDTFPREGQVRPEGTQAFIVAYDKAAAEAAAGQRRFGRRARHAAGRLLAAGRWR